MPDPALDATIEQARELFHDLGPITIRKMFGGAGLYHEGTIFCLIAFEEIFLKAKGDFAAELEAEGSAPFVYEGKDKPVTMSYRQLPDSALDDPDEAVSWARRALAALS